MVEEMGVALCRAQVLVAEDLAHRDQRDASGGACGGKVVTEVVLADVLEADLLAQDAPGSVEVLDLAAGGGAAHQFTALIGALHEPQHFLGDWDIACAGLGVAQSQHLVLPVDVGPFEAEDLVGAGAGE